MKIYNNETVVGVFDSDENVEQAVNKLEEMGLSKDDDEIQVVDQNRMGRKSTVDTPVTASPAPGTAGPGPAIVTSKTTDQDNQISNVKAEVESILEKLDVDGEEATFYARQVARGAKLMIVKTDSEHAPIALNVFKETGANALTTK